MRMRERKDKKGWDKNLIRGLRLFDYFGEWVMEFLFVDGNGVRMLRGERRKQVSDHIKSFAFG